MVDREIQVFDTVGELQSACADQVAEALRLSSTGQRVTIALSGGSTPRRLHELLAEADGIDWNNVHIFWGDERTVPPDHADSNFRMAKETLLDEITIPDENVHRMRGELNPVEAAELYEKEIKNVFDLKENELPVFDIILLGMGSDGHTASLFPGTDALLEKERLVVANHVPQMDTMRLTLTYPVLNNARLVYFLVAGDDKADAANRCSFNNPPPAGMVRPSNGRLIWMLDNAAASEINKQ